MKGLTTTIGVLRHTPPATMARLLYSEGVERVTITDLAGKRVLGHVDIPEPYPGDDPPIYLAATRINTARRAAELRLRCGHQTIHEDEDAA